MLLRKNIPVLIAVFFIAVSLGVSSCSATDGGKMAPDFTLKDLEGNDFRLSDTKGDVVILDFWATWCPPCRMEVPHFQELHDKYKGKGVSIVGVSLDRGDTETVRRFVENNGVTYPIVMGDAQTADAYGGIRAIPTTFIIDRNGRVVETAVGYRDKVFFEDKIKALL